MSCMSDFSTHVHGDKQTHSAYVTRTCVSWTGYLTVWSMLENAYNFMHHFRVQEQLVEEDFRMQIDNKSVKASRSW